MTLDTRGLFRLACPGSGARTLYVSPTGNDTNSGLTAGTALRQPAAAVAKAKAGDRIVLADGTYQPFSFYAVSGGAQSWITVEAANEGAAKIDAANNVTDGAAAVDVQLGAYIGVWGLEVFGNQQMNPVSISGMAIFRGSHHIRYWNCNVHDFPGGGINCFYIQSSVYNGSTLPAGGWDVVDLRYNTIHATSRYDPNNTSGISIFGAEDITKGGTWDGTYGYTMIGNYIYDIVCLQPYTAGGYDFVTDGNGISIDSLDTATVYNAGNAPYVKRGLVEGNVVAACGGRGVHGYNSINWDDQYNLYVGNLRTNSQAINNGIETDSTFDTAPGSTGVVHRGNIILPLNTPNTTDSLGTWVDNVILGGTQAVPAGNSDKRAAGVNYFLAAFTGADLAAGLPLERFIPAAVDLVSRIAGSYGYQVLARGPRHRSNTAAGALEKPLQVGVVV